MARWHEQIDLHEPLNNDALPFTERRDTIVARIKASRWFANDDGDLGILLEDLANAEDEDDFDEAWESIYDLADSDRVWLNAFAPRDEAQRIEP
jgi:hypothetical protein